MKIAVTAVAAVLLVLSVSGCVDAGSVWPFHRALPPAAAPAQELVITQQGLVINYPQYWQRNTLLVDLQGVSGSGRLVLRPRAGRGWPVRLALRVTPGAVGVLEVDADQRSVFPITTTPGKPVELELDPGVYSPSTDEIVVVWRPSTLAATP